MQRHSAVNVSNIAAARAGGGEGRSHQTFNPTLALFPSYSRVVYVKRIPHLSEIPPTPGDRVNARVEAGDVPRQETPRHGWVLTRARPELRDKHTSFVYRYAVRSGPGSRRRQIRRGERCTLGRKRRRVSL